MHHRCAEMAQANGGAHHVDDGVRRADFVEVDLLDRLAMDTRFHDRDGLEHGERPRPHVGGVASRFHQIPNRLDAPRWPFDAFGEPHGRPGAADAHLHRGFHRQFELAGQRQLAEFAAQMRHRHAHVDERAQVHVAGDAGEALVVQRPRQRRSAFAGP